MATPRILIVDDDPNVQYVLKRTLSKEGYEIETADDGLEAIHKIGQARYDLILLDLSMKPVGGLQVLNTVRERGEDSAVIILTGYSTTDSAVEALRLGAFDYFYKPASPDAIRQRVQEAIHHRFQMQQRSQLLSQIEDLRQSLIKFDNQVEPAEQAASPQRFLRRGKLVIDHYHRSATLGVRPLDLTTTEFDLLVCLAEAAPSPVSPQQLVLSALNYESNETEASEIIRYHIHQLRKKIEVNAAAPKYIVTVRYKGYLWSG
ncbi:MAG TPA: response regulator transcription factor [Terriglobia bacterium]|nr:response regulator transcription factor [Terriglobia bacterium]